MSCIEIYNESLFDLLGFSGGDDQRVADSNRYNKTNSAVADTVQTLALFESASGGPQVRGLKMRLIQNSEEGLNLLFESQMNRAIAEHQLNDASSRSHCIFTFHFVVRREGGKVMSSKLNIVDLAGSEVRGATGGSTISFIFLSPLQKPDPSLILPISFHRDS